MSEMWVAESVVVAFVGLLVFGWCHDRITDLRVRSRQHPIRRDSRTD